ncbi:MAG: hypothetical protein R3A10_10995 [Caldilineaceae bacterium]
MRRAGLYARAMLDEIGGFGATFFAYLEDVDLAWRARLAGWRCLYQPQARVLHAHSATSGEGSPFKSYLLGRNKVWLLAKNYPQPWLTLYLPVIVVYDLLAALYGWLTRGDAALLRGRWDGLRRLPVAMARTATYPAHVAPAAELGAHSGATGVAVACVAPLHPFAAQGAEFVTMLSALLTGVSLGFSAGITPAR